VIQRWQPFLERFLAIADDHPDATALCCGGEKIVSYRELRDRIARLAGALRRKGVAPHDLVALSLPRGIDLVVAELACWWTGAAFLPLDPLLPEARRDFTCRDAAARLVIGPGDGGAAGVLLRARADNGTPVPPHLASPGDLAYVVYTSGSTGQPRGVAVEHCGIVPLLNEQIRAFALGPGCRALWLLSPVFDASISDLGTTLLAGATLYLEADPELCDLSRLAHLLRVRQITHIDLPPALLRLLDLEQMPASLQTLVVGGEASVPEVIRRWARRFRVVNVYGPTEATICTSLCVCDPATWTEPLLGQPIAGIKYHVLDMDFHPVAPGETGELCIEGPCLARGYLNRPELTARKFITWQGRRLYRTGDQVRWRADGEYVFLGRLDRQVKLHGRLVEPEEVETKLLSHPQVCQAAVVKRPLGTGEALVAFVRRNSASLAPAALRQFLADYLPAWMLPARFVFVENLPQTSTGKIDLTLLTEMPLPRVRTATPDFVEAAILGRLYHELLGTPPDWQASFFEQGGDSLSLLQLVVAAGTANLVIPPALLASGSSLTEVADYLRAGGHPKVPPGALPAVELRRDAESVLDKLALENRVNETMTARFNQPACIFLTGASGFLGSYLLAELLRRTRAEIVCLARAASVEEGKYRPAAARSDRVRVVIGDVARPNLGLTPAAWQELAGRVDTIWHVAAHVNLVMDYEALRAANLLGTGEVLRLAATGSVKRLHYLSTLSVFVASDRNYGALREDDPLASTRWVFGGYAQSKWAAEWLARRAAGRAGPVAVYRPGLITGDSTTGKGSTSDFLTLFLRGLVHLGCLPPVDRRSLLLDVTPVDYCARALVHLSLHPAGPREGGPFHLAGAGQWSLEDLGAGLARRRITIASVNPAAWRERLAALWREKPDAAAACLALCRALPGPESFAPYRTLDLFQASGVVFDMRQTAAGLTGSGIFCPLPTPELLDRYIDHALSLP
jgi:amino acid adenylation domain-containing protein/thioester reductase-like protein